MKNILLALMLLLTFQARAVNKVVSVAQVTESVSISEAIDYHVTSYTPFTTAGSIDLQNEDAAVVFEMLRPSEVIKNYLSNIYVNGEPANNMSMCA